MSRLLQHVGVAVLAAALAAPGSLGAQRPDAAEATVGVFARVLQPIEVQAVTALDFGDVFRAQAAAVVDPTRDVQTARRGRVGERGVFTVSSSRDQALQLTLTLRAPVRLGGTEQLLITRPTVCITETAGACASWSPVVDGVAMAAPATSGGPTDAPVLRHVYVGGQLDAPDTIPLGQYAGAVTLRAEYTGL